MTQKKLEVMVPEEATERGPILKGELRSLEIRVSDILAQFARIVPRSKKAKIYFYPTLEQAKMLFGSPSPFAFEGTWCPREGVEEHWRSNEIWMNSGSSIGYDEMNYLTYCSGRLVDLHIKATSDGKPKQDELPSAWFVMNRCFLLQILATHDEEEIEAGKKYGMDGPIYKFALSGDAMAEIRRHTVSQSFGVMKEVKKSGYSIVVHGFKDLDTLERDVECLLILASLASRERSSSWHWSADEAPGLHSRYWRFGIPKWPKRPDGVEPLLLRDHTHCSNFLSCALKTYLNSNSNEFLDAAVYALFSRDLVLEVQIVRLFSGVQSALLFAGSKGKGNKRPRIEPLYKNFVQRRHAKFDDLWPLFRQGRNSGPSLYDIRNFIAHGGVFAERDWMALSYAAENLQWILERILLIALGWDIALSNVSPKKLSLYHAYNWKEQQQRLKL
ncbi:MAG: hypothetical protein ACJ71W_01795 [Terriglobales bacterium]